MLARGRNADDNKNWGRKVTCSYRDCSTNTKESDKKMFSFPKPCSAYVHSLIDPVRFEHSVGDCERCDKSFRWIRLCGNDGIANLEDVTARTYVCVKHFHHAQGPTEDWPDPLPARYYNADSKWRRAPSPLVEAIPCVEAVYDADAVSHRIQLAIRHANATNATLEAGTRFQDSESRSRRPKRSRETERLRPNAANPTNPALLRLGTETQVSRPSKHGTKRNRVETGESRPADAETECSDSQRRAIGGRNNSRASPRSTSVSSRASRAGRSRLSVFSVDSQRGPPQNQALDYTLKTQLFQTGV